MVNLQHYVPDCEAINMIRESISVTDLSSEEDSSHSLTSDESGYEVDEFLLSEDDNEIVPESELEKVKLLLRQREAVELDFTPKTLKNLQKEATRRAQKETGQIKREETHAGFLKQNRVLCST